MERTSWLLEQPGPYSGSTNRRRPRRQAPCGCYTPVTVSRIGSGIPTCAIHSLTSAAIRG